MAATFVEPLRSARQRTVYTEGKDGERPIAMYCDLGSTPLFVAYCERARRLHGRRVEAYGVRISFDDAELSASNVEDVQTAIDFGKEVCKRIAPDCPCHIVAHGDGEGGKLHVHCEIANADAFAGKAIRENRSASRVRQIADGLSREFGLSVIGETPAKRARWEESRGVEPTYKGANGWQAKRALPSVDEFERTLGDAVSECLESATSTEDFKRLLSERGIGIVEVPKREKDPKTGKRRDVVDHATGAVEIACWRYTMKDATGRMRRRKDANLCDAFRMHDVLPLLRERESAIARKQANEEKATWRARIARIERNESEKANRRLVVDASEVSKDLDALWRARFTEAMGKTGNADEPLMNLIRDNCADDATKRGAARDLSREVKRVHDERPASNVEGETPAQTKRAVLSIVEKRARNLITRMLAALWRMRIAMEQRMRRAIGADERAELVQRVIEQTSRQYGFAAEEPTTRKDERQMELEYTYSRGSHQLSL